MGARAVRGNWAGNLTYRARELCQAANVTEVQEGVASASRIRVLGSRHSFNDIADCDGVQVSLEGMNRILSIDADRRQVTVEGGLRFGDLAPALHEAGFALANLASLPHISVAGAAATATHGSGSGLGNLATAIAGMEVVTGRGELERFSRDVDPEALEGAVVGLGAVGAVVQLTLDIEPTYDLGQTVYLGLSHDRLAAAFDPIMGAGTSVSVFTDWRGDMSSALWVKNRIGHPVTGSPEEMFGVRAADRQMHPLPDGNGEDCTEQLGKPGPWHQRLPHFRMEFTPSNGAEIQAEYFFPRETAARVIAVMRGFGPRLAPILYISEMRTIAADRLWLSPGHRGDYLALHFTFRRDWEAIRKVLPAMEAELLPLGALPHWGKVTTIPPETIRAGYARMADFADLIVSRDPEGKFRNALIEQVVFGRG